MIKKLKIIVAVLFFSFIGYGQQTITGVVTDVSGEVLPGVTVLLKGTNIGTVTGFDGDYSLKIPENSKTIVFSYVGMFSQEIEITDNVVLNVKLREDQNTLDEVVVIGYGTINRGDITGSVASMKSDEITQSQSPSLMNALQGRLSGVQVTSESGEPGSGINIRIRGANSIVGGSTPLFIIDGVQIDVNKDEVASSGSSQGTMDPLSTINPADIESIDILKDASATAIYGSRGANGVVIITTKSGKEGETSFNYDGSFAVSVANNRIDVISADDYLNYQELRGNDSFLMRDTDNDGIPDTRRDFDNIPSHNWQDEALRTAFSQQHLVSASGGSKRSNYAASVGILSQEGVVKYNDYDRYNFRIRLNHIQSDKFKIGFNLNTAFSEAVGAANSGGPDSYTGVVQYLITANPWEIRDPDIDQASDQYISPLALLEKSDKTTRIMRVLGSVNADYKFSKNFAYHGVTGVNYSKSKLKEFYGSDTSWGANYNGRAAISEVGTYSYNHSSQLNYRKTFQRKHRVNAMIAFEVSHYNYERFRNKIAGFDDESTGVDDISKGAVTLEYSSNRWSTNRLSYLGRVNYSFDNKYLFTASLRADGSDKFGKENRWGYFPSGAFAWKVSNEDFMKNVDPINNLKLRLSYGETGNERISAYSYFARMENTYYASNNNVMYGLSPSSLENPNLKWETTAQFNVGIDFGFLNNRIVLNADYYMKQTRDMLLNAPVSAQSGFNSQWLNIGQIDNSGFEFNLSTVNIDTDDFSWDTNFNISFNKNTVKDIGGAEFIPVTIPGGWIRNPGRVIVGEPIGTMYGYQFDGNYQIDDFTWQNDSDATIPHADRTYTLKDDGLRYLSGTPLPGTQKYKDISGPNGIPDGQVDEQYDRTIIGDSNPKHIGGFNNTFRYKNFDLSMFFQWSYGNDIFNASKLRGSGFQPAFNLTQEYFDNHWSETTPINENPGIGQISSVPSSYFVEDGSYLRFKTLSLGYHLPKSVVDSMGMASMRLLVTGSNLYTWTKYSGFDPEVNSRNALMPGFDRISYPRSRTVTLGVNVKF